MKLALRILSLISIWLLLTQASNAQGIGHFFPGQSSSVPTTSAPASTPLIEIPGGDSPGRLSSAVEIAIVLTLVTLLPSLLMSVTSFLRIIIVLSFVRRAMGVQELPPNPVLAGLALFLTIFIMFPVGSKVYDGAVQPYLDGKLSLMGAGDEASKHLSEFLLKQTRETDLALFVELSKMERPESVADLPLRVIIPSFILSELKTSFQMGFIIFLPFLVIDLVVSSILLSMGMFMLPPVVISTPFKLLLFILVDGWNLVIRSLVTSFSM